MALNAKRRAFVEAYLQHWNGTRAADEAGYAHPGSQANRLLKNVEIQEYIQERLAELTMASNEVLTRLAEQARFDPLAYAVIGKADDGEGGEGGGEVSIDLQALKDAGLGHLVKRLYYDKYGRLVVEFHDGQAALVHIGRHHGLFKGEGPQINLSVHMHTEEMTDDELAAIAAGRGQGAAPA